MVSKRRDIKYMFSEENLYCVFWLGIENVIFWSRIQLYIYLFDNYERVDLESLVRSITNWSIFSFCMLKFVRVLWAFYNNEC